MKMPAPESVSSIRLIASVLLALSFVMIIWSGLRPGRNGDSGKDSVDKAQAGALSPAKTPLGTKEIIAVKVALQKRLVESAINLTPSTDKDLQLFLEDQERNLKEANGDKDLANRLEYEVDVICAYYLRSSTKWSPQTQELAQRKMIDYAAQATRLFNKIGGDYYFKQMGCYEKLELICTDLPENILQHHEKYLDDPKSDLWQTLISAQSLGIYYAENDNYPKAAQVWLKAIDRAKAREGGGGAEQSVLARLLADYYQARSNFQEEEKYRRMAVQTDLQMAMHEYDWQIRKDVSKWQQCIARTGDKKAADSLNESLSGNDEGLRRWFDSMELNAKLTVPPTYTCVDENGNVRTYQNL